MQHKQTFFKYISDFDKSVYGYYPIVELNETEYRINEIIFYDSMKKETIFVITHGDMYGNLGDVLTNDLKRKVKLNEKTLKGDFIFKSSYDNRKKIKEIFNDVDLDYVLDEQQLYILFVDLANKPIHFYGRFIKSNTLYYQYIINKCIVYNKEVKRINGCIYKLEDKLCDYRDKLSRILANNKYDVDINEIEQVQKQIKRYYQLLQKSMNNMQNSQYYNQLRVEDRLLEVTDTVYCSGEPNMKIK